MKTFLRWVARILGALVGVTAIGLLTIFVMSELIIGETFVEEGRSVEIPGDTASSEKGRKIAITRGCLGCHSRDGGGGVLVDSFLLATLPAPNLTRLVHERSIEELDRSIRRGVRSDGMSVVAMPSGMLQGLSDEDFASLVAYLRSLPRVDRELPERRFGLMARFGLATGKFHTERGQFEQFPRVRPMPEDPVQHGKYLVVTTCTECHGPDLHGAEMANAPDLVVVGAYSRDNFLRLMREGIPQDGSELGLMKSVAVGRFSNFSEDELDAIYRYLSSPEFLSSGAASQQAAARN